jgi:thiol-disulfide isomerase/thioredoxin
MRYYCSILMLLLSLITTSSHANSVTELEKILSESKGQVVYLDFWASWCGPCRKSFPWLNAMQAKYEKQNFRIISINVDAERALADDFLQALPASFKVIYDPQGKLASQFKLKGMPSSYLINKQGEIVSAHVGFINSKKQKYEQEIIQLINQNQ